MSGEKAGLRHRLLARVRELDEAYLLSSGEALCRRVLDMPQYRAAKTVFAFAGTGWEVDTAPLLRAALAAGKRLCVPLCAVPGQMEARLLRDLAELTPGAYGIPAPPEDAPLCPPEEIDFAAVPCLSCTRTGIRLGRGGGYYDRFLAGRSLFTAALCRETMLSDSLPAEPWDVPVDAVVTENAVILRPGGGTEGVPPTVR